MSIQTDGATKDPTGGGTVGPESLTVRLTVANQTARYALTAAEVQAGDLVWQTDTGRLYEVVDVAELGNSSGYQDLDEASMAALATHAAGSGVHAIAGVTGLQAALDAKAPTADPTFTGPVTVEGWAQFGSGGAAGVIQNDSGNLSVRGNDTLELKSTAESVDIYTNDVLRLRVGNDGSATVDATFGASLAAALGAGAWTMVSKSTDETITSDSTLSNDSALSFAVAANTKYRFRFHVVFKTGATADFKYALTGPASPTLLACRISRSAAFGSVVNYRPMGTYAEVAESLTGAPSTGDQEGGYVLLEGVLHNGSNAGTVAFQWAQDTSDAGSTKVLAGSYLEWKQV